MRRSNSAIAGILSSVSLIGCLTVSTPSQAGETIRIGGTGSGLAAMRMLGAEFTKRNPGTEVEVMASLGTLGGIEALGEGAIDVGLAARGLKPDESAKGVREATCMTTALVFAANHDGQGAVIRSAELPALFRDPRPTWPDGTPLKLILRARTGSEYPYLIKVLPAMGAALDEAHQRRGVPMGATDQENADLAQRTAGSLAMTTLLQIRAEKLGLRMLPLDGVEPSTETVADGSYPFPFRICLLLPVQPSAIGQQFVSFFESREGRDMLHRLGAVEEKKVNP